MLARLRHVLASPREQDVSITARSLPIRASTSSHVTRIARMPGGGTADSSPLPASAQRVRKETPKTTAPRPFREAGQ